MRSSTAALLLSSRMFFCKHYANWIHHAGNILAANSSTSLRLAYSTFYSAMQEY